MKPGLIPALLLLADEPAYSQVAASGERRACLAVADYARWDVTTTDTSCGCRDSHMGFNIHDLGDLVRVTAAFTDPDDDDSAFDPDSVRLSVREPDGTVTTYVYGVDALIEKDSVGNYYADIDAEAPGVWYYHWHSTGDGQAASEKRFQVRRVNAQ